MWVRARWLAGAVTMLALAALQLAGSAMPAGAALGPNEALVCSDGTGGVVSVLDLTTGRLREIPSAPVAAIPPMVLPGRQSFAYWQGGDSSPYTLWLVTLPDTRKRLYTAPEGYKPIAATWWQAHYCVLTAMGVGESGRLLLATPQGASREVEAWLDEGAGRPTVALGCCQVVLGLGDGQHALACSVGQAVRVVVEMNSGRGTFLGQGWERLETLAWPWQANLALQNPHLNPVDGRIYATLRSFVWTDEGAHTPELAQDFLRRLAQASGIYSFKPDGSDLRRVSIPPAMGIGTYRFPALVDLSPDGQQMLYAYYDYGVEGSGAVPGLYICGLDGSRSRPVPGEGAKLNTAAWGS